MTVNSISPGFRCLIPTEVFDSVIDRFSTLVSEDIVVPRLKTVVRFTRTFVQEGVSEVSSRVRSTVELNVEHTGIYLLGQFGTT